MLFLLLRILFSTAFSHLLRFSQSRTRRPLAAAAINYGIAALFCAGWAAAAGAPPHAWTLVLGALAGFTYVSSLVLMLPAMRQSGVSVTGTVVQLSLLLPVGAAVWRFGEMPTAGQWAGMSLAVAALPLLSLSRAALEEPLRIRPLTAMLFLSAGCSQVLMKEFSATRPARELALYSAALFVSAALFTALWVRFAPSARETEEAALLVPGRLLSEWSIGTALGAANVLQLVFLLLALRELPAVLVFPLSAVLAIVFNAVVSMLLWKERPGPAGWAGIALSTAAVALLSRR